MPIFVSSNIYLKAYFVWSENSHSSYMLAVYPFIVFLSASLYLWIWSTSLVGSVKSRSLSRSVKLWERTTETSKNKVCFFFPFSQLSLCAPADVTCMYIVKHCLSDVATLYHGEMFLLRVSRNTPCPEVCSDAHIMTLALVYHCLHGTSPACCSELTCDVGLKACVM